MARGQRCEERVCHVGHAFFWEAEADRDNPGIRGEAPRLWNLDTRWPDVPPTSPADTSGSGTETQGIDEIALSSTVVSVYAWHAYPRAERVALP